MRQLFQTIFIAIIALFINSCTRLEPKVVVITATPTLEPTNTTVPINLSTPAATNVSVIMETNHPTMTYVVQPGDTLTGIANAYGVNLTTLLELNDIEDADTISVGQILVLPDLPNTTTPSFKIIPDGRFIRGPSSATFDTLSFVNQQSGYIRIVTDSVDDVLLTAGEIIQRVSEEYSVDPRMLIAILEYRSHWLTKNTVDENLKAFPIQGVSSQDGFDRSGLYKQLAWTANQLNVGYYNWKYNDLSIIEFDDGARLTYALGLNAGTIGIQRFLSIQREYSDWSLAVSEAGLYSTYKSLFGDPFENGNTEVLPHEGLTQPLLALPFAAGQTWFFTGGPHGGWGSGSAWSAIDFAPPDDRPDGSAFCYISEFWATAVADGIITKSSNGTVILDLDVDGNDTTGWTIVYLHLASDGRIPNGTFVKIGDPIGKPSCEGGFSTATHLHIARRYNGEWIPANDGGNYPFIMSGWTIFGYSGQEYQGYMTKNGERRDAEQGRLTPINRVSW